MAHLLKDILCIAKIKYLQIKTQLAIQDEPDEIYYISGGEVLPPPLTADEESDLLSNFSSDSYNIKKTLVERNLRLVVYVARKFENTGICIEDLISIGSIGLIKAINSFDPTKNIKLATYASRCIENEILMFLSKNHNRKTEVSIDEPLNTDWDGNELLLSDVLGTDSDEVYRKLEDEVDRQLLHSAIDKLSSRERSIMELRFGLGNKSEKTQKEVADMLGISQSYISRLEKRIIARLKKEISKMI
ncbi:MAG: RNA polymerase sporulation sigma factor SigE [Clostridia bacterium]|nr:RNA polymerase sporulation sigma factor SigE [Clostridia bacterium]